MFCCYCNGFNKAVPRIIDIEFNQERNNYWKGILLLYIVIVP